MSGTDFQEEQRFGAEVARHSERSPGTARRHAVSLAIVVRQLERARLGRDRPRRGRGVGLADASPAQTTVVGEPLNEEAPLEGDPPRRDRVVDVGDGTRGTRSEKGPRAQPQGSNGSERSTDSWKERSSEGRIPGAKAARKKAAKTRGSVNRQEVEKA
jgi:hypothetical protein